MGAGGHFRHHAAVGAMVLELREHQVAENALAAVDHRRRRLVATRLDAEDDHPMALPETGSATVPSALRRGHISEIMPNSPSPSRSAGPSLSCTRARGRIDGTSGLSR